MGGGIGLSGQLALVSRPGQRSLIFHESAPRVAPSSSREISSEPKWRAGETEIQIQEILLEIFRCRDLGTVSLC